MVNKNAAFAFVLACLFSLSLSSALLTVTTTSPQFQDRNFNIINESKYVGDRIIVNATVFNSEGWFNTQRAYLSWGSSWVDCNRLLVIPGSNSSEYKCILTITPTMNNPIDLYLKVESRTESQQILIGQYNPLGTYLSKKVCEMKTVKVSQKVYYCDQYRCRYKYVKVPTQKEVCKIVY